MPEESRATEPAISSFSSPDDSDRDRFEEMSQHSYSGIVKAPEVNRKKNQRSKKNGVLIIEQNGSGSHQAANTISSSVLVPTKDTMAVDPSLEAPVEEMLQLMKLEDKLTGGKKDMESYKFWSTQPIARFDEEGALKPDGPVRDTNPEVVPPHGVELLDGFEWVTMDLNDPKHLDEIYELLKAHYVEDNEAMFRFNYSIPFLSWALKPPGWIPEWFAGVRVTKSRKLVAFISGVPASLRVRKNTIRCSEINFLCIHKKLRSKRLAPVLIGEIARRCDVEKCWNAVYTTGVVLPSPVSTCRYFHRYLNWLKLYEVGFSSLPHGSTQIRQTAKFKLPSRTSIKGLREMELRDLDATHNLLKRYLEKFDMAPEFDINEAGHWLLHNNSSGSEERVVYTYVVEDEGRITDFFSFYALETSVISSSSKHKKICAAYLSYYATEVAPKEPKKELKIRLNALINDALIISNRLKFDVFNALTLLDNNLFLNDQKFTAGDGQLHYHLFNWRTTYIRGGIDEQNDIDEENGSGVGLIML
ncbi:acyl-CoA N-acyltransferase [Morchella snyderi]|nr:acyl-CoA N-acyltransferase [Morchella snyderi]